MLLGGVLKQKLIFLLFKKNQLLNLKQTKQTQATVS
jgi:hypothetical protein